MAFDRLHKCLELNGDLYLNNSAYQVGPESYTFRFDIIIRDRDRRFRRFWFPVNGESAPFGVLRLVYAEEEEPRSPPSL